MARVMGRPLRIAQIGSRGIPGHRGGVERVVEAVTPRLVAAGHDVTVYCATWSDHRPAQWRGVRLVYARSFNRKYLDTFLRSVVATVRACLGRHDIVHLHGSGSAPLALLVRLARKHAVVTVHGMDWQRRKWNVVGRSFLKFGEWAAVRLAHHTVVVGPDLKQWLDEKYDADTTFIPNGVETRLHRPPNRIRDLGLGERDYVLFLARLVPEKRVHTLISAWIDLADRRDMQLAIAGPAWHSSEYARSLVDQAADDPSVRFLGEVDEYVLEELYSNCYAYVLPSEVEGMSLSLLDAMAFGACVVCSDIGPNRTVVGDAGVTFAVGDDRALRGELDRLLADPDRAADLRAAAQKRIDLEYHWDRVVERWIAMYDEVLAR